MKVKETSTAVSVAGGSDSTSYDALSGGGEMGALIRSLDWANTPLGPVESWPQSLRTTVSLCLSSTFPILITWGPENVQIYNDSYQPICGAKHPQAMGQKFNECWATALPVVGEIFARAWSGKGSYIENQRMFLDRDGYLEEAFMTFSFSPIRDESGEVGGLFHPITETTNWMLSSRRTQAVRDFSTQIAKARTENEIVDFAEKTYGANHLDLPFFLIYQQDESGKSARLIKSVGLLSGTASTPDSIDLENENQRTWPLVEVARSKEIKLVSDLERLWGPLICEPYPEALREAVILPILISGVEHPFGFLIAGVSARRAFDVDYFSFYESLGAAVNTAFTNVRAYELEKKRAAALAEIDRAKTAFFSNVSHEFRTPLTLMLGPLEDNLAHPNLSLGPEHRVRDELAYRAARRLLKLVNSLLDFSRIEAGRMKAVFRPTDLSKLTAELSGMFRAAIEKVDIKLIVETTGLHESVYVDREMWEKVVLNLLSNAFKFTLQGEIEVRLTQANGRACLRVRDTGVGVPASEIPHLFERFHRVEGAQGRTHEGTGIGLALTQELIKLHHGTISVRSELGKGSEFTVEIPLGKVHLPADHIGSVKEGSLIAAQGAEFIEEALRWLPDSQTSPASFDSPDKDQKRARILIADDNSDMRNYVKNLLQAHWDIETVADGEAALASVNHQAPDLILSDVMMPKMDGLELIKRLRANPKTRGIPCILLSARAGEESRIEGLETGADDYLIKPFSAKELLARVQTHFQIGKLRAEAVEQSTRMNAIFMQAPVAICVLDGPEHVFTLSNAMYDQLAQRKLLGRKVREAFSEAEVGPFFELLDRVYETGEPFIGKEASVPLLDPEGGKRERFLDFSYHPLRDLLGHIKGILALHIDVTDRVKSRQALEESKAMILTKVNELEKQRLLRERFVATLTHDLRTPLTTAKMCAHLISRRESEPGKIQKLCGQIADNIDRADDMIRDLLDANRIGVGQNLPVYRVQCDLRETIALALEDLTTIHGSRFIFVHGDRVSGFWDHDGITRIIENLCGNAIKYGALHSPVTVTVIVHQQKSNLEISVHNEGTPIPGAEQELLFSQFHRSDSAQLSAKEGWGIGLTLVRGVAEANGGQVTVRSVQSEGTTFTVTLPLGASVPE